MRQLDSDKNQPEKKGFLDKTVDDKDIPKESEILDKTIEDIPKESEILDKTIEDIPEESEISDKTIEKGTDLNIPEERFDDNQNRQIIPSGMIIALVAVVAIAGFFAGIYFSNLNADIITKSDLDEAISKLESKIEDAQQAAPQAPTVAQAPTQPMKISLDDDPMRGDPNAPITIVEFSDFQCPFCARFHVQTLPKLLEEYIDPGKVNFVYRDFPIQSIHPNALPAAVAAECANEQGMYWEYHDTLFEKQSAWSRENSDSVISTFSQYATDLGLEQQQFDSCLGTGKYLEEVQGDLNDGRDYDITGTPGFFIGNDQIGFVKINGAQPFESFQRVIDAQLNS